MESPESFYSRQQTKYQQEAARYSRLSRALSWLRLILFLLLLGGIYLALGMEWIQAGTIISGISLILLIVLVIINVKVNRSRKHQERLLELCSREIRALQFDFLDFPDGSSFAEPDHPYAADLDLFGHGSVYQYINRTATSMGEERLVDWLKRPCLELNEIILRQDASRELCSNPGWRLEFAACGLRNDPGKLLAWLRMPLNFRNHSSWKRWILAARIAVILLAFSVAIGWVPYPFLITLGLVNLGIVGLFIKRINRVSNLLNQTAGLLESYEALFTRLGEIRFNSRWITQRTSLLLDEEGGAVVETGKLSRLLNQFDSRNNLLVGFFRNALFLTDLHLVVKMEDWRLKNSTNVTRWFEVLGEMDAMNSLAAFSFNNPAYAYPRPLEGAFSLRAADLGHPLINPSERVCNTYSLDGWHSLQVLTGANMAGKSTFLRTVGLNHVLAHTGAVVCATHYEFLPSRLFSSIRTNDSLIRHESYFYAELKKLQQIIQLLEEGKELFILLDEVLKGTNSNDKLKGSVILVKKLLQLPASGIIATHDIALGELENEFPANIRNKCFEAEIHDGTLTFDYKLREGAATNMTALFLMKQMNIV